MQYAPHFDPPQSCWSRSKQKEERAVSMQRPSKCRIDPDQIRAPSGMHGTATAYYNERIALSLIKLRDSSRLRLIMWVYSPGHAGVKGNDRAE